MPLKLLWLLLLIVVLTSSTQTLAQVIEYNGLYIIIEKQKDCPNLIATYNNVNVKYCVSQRPIISADEFISVSEINRDSIARIKVITLKLSQNGYNTWKGIIKTFPESRMALIVNGFVTGTFKNKGDIIASIIPISGNLNSPEIEWIYQHLKKPQASEKKE